MKVCAVALLGWSVVSSMCWAEDTNVQLTNVQLTTAKYKDYLNVKTPLVLVGIARVKAEDVGRFVSIARSYRKTMRSQKGNLAWSLDHSLSNSTEFMWVEEWKDGRSLAEHIESAAVKELSSKVNGFYANPMSVVILMKE